MLANGRSNGVVM
uniref:Uncharacterized protein n=1 Tax=Anguilla anguilla TaxID=7936 RepID=A0A0E9V8T7_ANGAN